MEQNNRRNRSQDDDYDSSNYNQSNYNYNRSANYNDRDRSNNYRDRNDDWGTDYRGYNNENRNVYSSDRERDYWNNQNEQRNDLNTNDRYYNRPNSSYMNTGSNTSGSYMNSGYDRYRYGNDYYNNRYRNEGWRDRYNQDNDRDWWDKTKDEVSSWFGDDEAKRRRRVDEYREGEHRGKGPKNYNRSAERIKEDASDRLSDDSLIDASNIEIEVTDNELTLNGTVDTRYEKRRAEDLVENVSGVKNVQNNLRVSPRTISNSDTNNVTSNNSTYSATKNYRETADHR